jgi:hypothetical protein
MRPEKAAALNLVLLTASMPALPFVSAFDLAIMICRGALSLMREPKRELSDPECAACLEARQQCHLPGAGGLFRSSDSVKIFLWLLRKATRITAIIRLIL